MLLLLVLGEGVSPKGLQNESVTLTGGWGVVGEGGGNKVWGDKVTA